MILGVDVGGTFTDAALATGRELVTAKAPTTPRDQSEGVIAAVQAALERAGASPDDVTRFVHSMTTGTNALLEGQVAKTALFATAGFTDIEELGRQARPELYRLCVSRPPPLVPAERRHGVEERCGPDGELRELDEARLRETIEELPRDIEAAAVCLLWGFRHHRAEQRVAEMLAELRPALHVSTSHETAAVFREYERCATSVVDAALSPLLGRYLDRLGERAAELGLPSPEVMLSSGGVAEAAIAARHGSWTVLSGPAAGAVGASTVAARAGEHDIVALDMGGTSCDVSLSSGAGVALRGDGEVAGRPLALPTVDVHTVGAGGGSIGWRDPGGALRVGPRSAGADPGPACYGRGGTKPTVTDANLLLGYLDAGSPLAGGVALDRDAAERAVSALAASLELETTAAAEGIVRVASTEMARAVRVTTVERGVDPRELSLFAFGGAGPLHAAAIADELEMGRVVVPRDSGVLSAVGLIASERRRDLAESVLFSGGALTTEAVAAVVGRLADRGHEELKEPDARVRARFDLRYRGQAFELTVDGEPAPDPSDLRRAFEQAHAERYGYRDADGELELVTVRVAVATDPTDVPEGDPPEPTTRRSRRAIFNGRTTETRVVDGVRDCLSGPAIVELREATVVVPPGWRCEPAGASALVMVREASSREAR